MTRDAILYAKRLFGRVRALRRCGSEAQILFVVDGPLFARQCSRHNWTAWKQREILAMGLFGGIKNTYKKSEAAVVVQNLLAMQVRAGMVDLDPASTATGLVEAVWTESPHMFDGRFGQRPHKISVAAASLAKALDRMSEHDPTTVAFALSLGNIINEVSVNGNLYPFNSIDMQLMGAATSVYGAVSERMMGSPLGQEIEEILGAATPNWNEWYSLFKDEAGKHHSGLVVDEKGFSLVDLMDHEPLKRACQDEVDPRSLGKRFASQFDPVKMGFS